MSRRVSQKLQANFEADVMKLMREAGRGGAEKWRAFAAAVAGQCSFTPPCA